MNRTFLGDSYDIVKRFFCQELRTLKYDVVVNPMFTGDWQGNEPTFFRLICAQPKADETKHSPRTALFVDPDTGINGAGSERHVSFEDLEREASKYALVFSFDQSFSRQASPRDVMQIKLAKMTALECHAMYYDSHARFLFISKQEPLLDELCRRLISIGIPKDRLIKPGVIAH